MRNGVLHAFVIVAMLGCQQSDGSEAADEVAATMPTRPVPIPSADADVRAAQSELAEGRSARATTIIMPVLRSPERRTPEALLVAARAAADWRGWTLVRAILAYEPWLSTQFNGEGLELLARSALARDEATEARKYAEDALRVRSEPAARAVRLVLFARALDRLNVRDSAAATYRRAAELLPAARDWLLLRAAGTTADEGARQRLYANVRATAARGRIPNTEAQALERFGMTLAAANAYEKLGDMPSAFRLRLASDNARQRASLRAGLLGYLQRDARGDDLQRGFEVLDAAYPRLDLTSELIATRRAAEGGVPARAVTGYAKIPAASMTDADVIALARALIATGRPAAAAARIATRRFGAASAAEGMYVRGLGLVRSGRTTAARASLRQLVVRHKATGEAADALYLLADLESDAGREARARELFSQSCLHKPEGGFSGNACFRSGILSYALGNTKRAASAFEEVASRFPTSTEALAALYWCGRAWEKAGNATLAIERWNQVMANEPYSYYSLLSARRLGRAPLAPLPAPFPRASQFQPTLIRAAVLDQLGMDVEERYEYEGIEDEATASPTLTLSAGAVLLERGEVPRAIKLGWRAVTAGRMAADSTGNPDQRGYALIYPLLLEVQLLARSRENNLDPALVAAVIRQESSWNPRAVSRAGARGLMQIMPAVGQSIARTRGYPAWDPALLFDPEVSLDLGTKHLSAALSAYSNPYRALAAYNAGGTRVRRWVRRAGASDAELFVERIPFVETRDYVRIVTRNQEMYRSLHGLTR